MEYTRFGTTDIAISRLCVGGMNFGKVSPDFRQRVVDQEVTQAVIVHTLGLDVNFIDIANIYSRDMSGEFIEISLKNLDVEREDVVLANKICFNEGHPSRGAIEREINDTSKRLGTDYLDPYTIHRFGYATLVEETLKALDTPMRSGRVRALGVSLMYAYQLHATQVTADAHGQTRFSFVQNYYNLLYREDEWEITPVRCQYGMLLTLYSPLVSGRLTRPTWDFGSVRPISDATIYGKCDRGREIDISIIGRAAELTQCHQVAMADIALTWLWVRGVAAPIVDCSQPSRVGDAVRALGPTLTGEEIAFLEKPYVPRELVGPLVRPENISQR